MTRFAVSRIPNLSSSGRVLPKSRFLTTAPPIPLPARRRFFSNGISLTVGLASGFALALFAPRPNLLAILFPAPTPVSPGHDTPEGILHTLMIENGLQDLPIVRSLRALKVPAAPTTPAPTSSLTPPPPQTTTTELVPTYTESRPYARAPAGPHSLSAYTLRGPGKFAVPPLVFTSRDKREAVFVLHVGGGLCGHEGIVHGGVLATVLDEAMGRTAFFSLPSKIGVTATLSLSYKKPTFAEQYLVMRTETVDVKGRKVWVKGRVETLDGQTLVEAEALFVEPKMAKFLNSSTVRDALA